MRLARLLGAVGAVLLPLGAAPASAAPAPRERVVVQGPAEAVRRVGGRVTRDLPLVHGVAAVVPRAALARLAADPAVRAVTPDAEVTVSSVQTADYGDGDVRSVYREETGAAALNARGVTGSGVRVALVDTGVTETPDLAGRVVDVADPGGTPAPLRSTVRCVDFSGEGDCVDRYGHGTFLAGLIAGNGASSGGRFAGMAPGAEIVSIKIAGRNGAADVSKVLAAIQWVVSFHERYGITVLNLSLGTPSRVPYRFDPLNLAVEQAWRAGITVVVAAGNSGPQYGTVAKPGDDPLVITVGAVDDRETTSVNDDRLPNFSSRGPTHDGLAKPDVVAPGAKLVSQRLADSYIEEQAGPGQMAATYPAYRRGSGTSMATAVTSGAVALLLQRHPDWTPDRVKYALMDTARRVATSDRRKVGQGLIQTQHADTAGPGLANRDVTVLADGTGTLEGSRGGVHVGTCKDSEECARCDTDATCPPVTGENTAQGRPYVESEYTGGDWTDSSWYTSQWAAPLLDTGWYGNSWLGNSWLGNSWLGNSWLGSSFYGDSGGGYYGRPASGGAWYGAWL